MKRALLLIVVYLLALTTPAFAQNGGPVTIQAIDPSTNATVGKVGSASDNSLRVHIIASDVSSAGGTSSSFAAAFPASGTAAGYSDGTNMQGARVFDLDTGGGTQYGLGINLRRAASGGSAELIGSATSANSIPVVVASDQGAFAVNNTQQGTASQNVAQINGVTTLAGNGVTGTGSLRVTVASDNTAFTVNAAQSGAWSVSTKPIDACGTTNYDAAAALGGTSLTSITASTTCVDSVVVSNTGASAVTILLQDAQGSPLTYIPTTTLAPNGQMQMLNLAGMKFTSGIKIQASAATVTYAIKGRQ